MEARSTEAGAKAEAEAAKVRAMAAEIFMVDSVGVVEMIMVRLWCLYAILDVK